MAKRNAYMDRLVAQIRADYLQRLDTAFEIDLIALMITASDELQVGPGRAENLLTAYKATRLQVAANIVEDSSADSELLATKHDIALRLREIFGPSWEAVRENFPLLKLYWGGEK